MNREIGRIRNISAFFGTVLMGVFAGAAAIPAVPLMAAVIAQGSDGAAATPRANLSRQEYPDAGQAFGMQWDFEDIGSGPTLSFHVPETDNRLWLMTCDAQKDGSVRIANTVIAAPKELAADDRFGFTIRVDNGQSIGILARMAPINLEGEEHYVPQFYLPNNHALFPALARGNRAFVNLNGNKFSLHLGGSGDAIKAFLRACS